ncbi:MAG: carbon storage regulator CsrA [Desulfobulbaceae bacterium]|nr:carbon storage regulator CsrA [Candidatus Kapabacteria bacterium]MBS3999454.1 carbon storage regulator CsrA [Desulfobulbaceae bacterium]
MLVLSRKIGEVINIGSTVTVTVLSYDRGVVRLGIAAPKSVAVHRKEVYDKIIEINRQAARTQIEALKIAISASKVNWSSNEMNKVSQINVASKIQSNKDNSND